MTKERKGYLRIAAVGALITPAQFWIAMYWLKATRFTADMSAAEYATAALVAALSLIALVTSPAGWIVAGASIEFAIKAKEPKQ